MILKEKNGIAWLEFELFSEFKDLQHGIFLRHGGVSEGPFSSLNFSLRSGDAPSHVETNRQLVKDLFQLHQWANSHLNHGAQTAVIDANNFNNVHVCDALITKEQAIGLLITHADCQAAIFYDPTNRVLANVHAGWRGNVQNIYAQVIEVLMHQFNCRPENLFVGISPSLGPDDAEFIHYRTEFPPHFWAYETKQNYFNLWEISRSQLEEKGILPQHNQIAEISTLSNPEDYFSYRRTPLSGRHGTLAALRKRDLRR
jgi:polyphenol oxidase